MPFISWGEGPFSQVNEANEKKCKGCGLMKSPVNSEGFCRQCVHDNNKEDGLEESLNEDAPNLSLIRADWVTNKISKAEALKKLEAKGIKEDEARKLLDKWSDEYDLQEESEYPKDIKARGDREDVVYRVRNKSEEDHLNQLLAGAENRGGSERLQRLAAAKGQYGVK
jgi:hypothetical protein